MFLDTIAVSPTSVVDVLGMFGVRDQADTVEGTSLFHSVSSAEYIAHMCETHPSAKVHTLYLSEGPCRGVCHTRVLYSVEETLWNRKVPSTMSAWSRSLNMSRTSTALLGLTVAWAQGTPTPSLQPDVPASVILARDLPS